MKRKSLIFFFIFISATIVDAQTIKSLPDYLKVAEQNNPALKENLNLAQISLLQNNLTLAQLRKPQLNLTSDYLFAPYFFNNGNFISVTQNPEKNAYGYDAALTNGGLYALQLNITAPLFNSGVAGTFSKQNFIQKQMLENNNKQLVHELEKNVSDQYLAVYRLQQQLSYLEKIISIVEGRKKIAEQLVQNGLMQQNDFLLLEIEISNAQNYLLQQQINLSDAFAKLNNTCGISDTTKYELSTPIITPSQPLQKFNYQQKFELDSANIISQKNIFNTKYKPQLNVFGNTGLYAADAANISHNVGMSAGLHLNIPLYDGGQKKIMEQQNKLQLQTLQQYNQNATVQLQNNLNTLQQQINLTQQSLALLNAQLNKQETLLQIIEDKVVTGQISVTDYLNAVQNYAEANQNKIQTQTNLWLLINQYNYVNW